MLLFMAYPPPSSSIGSSSSKARPVSSTSVGDATNAAMTTVATTGATTAATSTCQERVGLDHASPQPQQSPDISLLKDASSNDGEDEEAEHNRNGRRRGLRRGRRSRTDGDTSHADDDSVEASGCCNGQFPRLKNRASSSNNKEQQQQQNDQHQLRIGNNPAEEKDHEQQERHRPTFFQQMEDVPRVYIEKLYENTVDGPCQVTLCEVKHMDLFMVCFLLNEVACRMIVIFFIPAHFLCLPSSHLS